MTEVGLFHIVGEKLPGIAFFALMCLKFVSQLLQNAFKCRLVSKAPRFCSLKFGKEFYLQSIRESVDSLCRDGTDMPIVCVHTKAF